MGAVSDLGRFSELAVALEPWLDRVVIVGGWAHRLHRLHPRAQSLSYPPLVTLDADVAIPQWLPVEGQDIRQRLISSGFTEEFLGRDHPPATHYHLGDTSSGFYVEFLTPLVGGDYDRENRRKATLRVAGATSQQLRHIGLLLKRPWMIDLSEGAFKGRVQVANPASFVVQKLLIHRRRKVDDRARDLLYIYDTLQLFGSRLPELRIEWRVHLAPQIPDRTLKDLVKSSRTLFLDLSDDVRRAARISPERQLTPEAIREACAHGLGQLLA